jgi:hypothetical protein
LSFFFFFWEDEKPVEFRQSSGGEQVLKGIRDLLRELLVLLRQGYSDLIEMIHSSQPRRRDQLPGRR